MINYEECLAIEPYSLDRKEKHKFLTENLVELTRHHYSYCSEYRRMLDNMGIDIDSIESYYDIPFLPV